MPLVGKNGSQRDAPGAAPQQPRYQVKIVGGRRVVVWQDGDNGLQQPHRSPPSRTTDPLRSQVRVDSNPAIRVTSSGGGEQSQYRPAPPSESPQRVPADRPVSPGPARTEAGSDGAAQGEERSGQQPEQEAGQSIVGSHQPRVNYSQSAPRRRSDVTSGGLNTSFSVLPPISSTGSGGQRKKLAELEDITLKNEVYRNADLIQERRVQRILNEMRTLDRDRDGVLDPSHVRHILHKHQLKFSPDVDDSLLTKFSETPRSVHYEKLVQYLSSVKLEASRTVTPPDEPPSRAPVPPKLGRSFTERDEARLKQDLASYLRLRPLDLEQVSRTFFDLDRDRNGFLSAQQVEMGLHRCGLEDMPQELLQRLCAATDKQGNGLCNIDKLSSYLSRASPGASRATGTIQGIGNNHRPRLPKAPPPVNSNASYHPPHPTYQPRMTDQEPDDQLADVAPPDPAEAVPYDTAYPPSPPAPQFDRERWTADYQHLVNTLYGSGDDNGGYLNAEEVGHITETYNTIYNLGIPFELVNHAMSQATEPTYGMIQLSVYTDVLMNLFLNSV